MSEIRLKRCAHCGGHADFHTGQCGPIKEYFYVQCSCGMQTDEHLSQVIAARVWNRRVRKPARKGGKK